MNNFFGKLLAIGILAYFAWQIWDTHKEKQSSLNWPEAKAYLVEAHVKEVRESENDDRGITTHSSNYFTVSVKYDYYVNQTWYHGDRLKIGGERFSSESQAAARLRELQNQKTLVVYYNPAAPDKSTLTR